MTAQIPAAATDNNGNAPSEKFLVGLDQIDWGYLLTSIQDEKCILCVGPDVFTGEKGERLEKQLAAHLRSEEQKLGIRVYEDGWFHYLPGASKIDAWQRVKDFFNRPNSRVDALLEKIAALPFHFILTFTPDYRLKQAFERKGVPCDFQSYLKGEPFKKDAPAPSKSRPALYNLLGEINKRNSLVMTYDDFYSYLLSVHEGISMSDVLKEKIWDADYFIFLGLPFDKWYVHLFMRILEQHDKMLKVKKYAANVFLDQHVATHCGEQYTITSIPSGIASFVDMLHEKCGEAGLLRKTSAAAPPPFSLPAGELKQLLVDNEFKEFFEKLLAALQPLGEAAKDLANTALNLQAQLNQVRTRRYIEGVITADEEESSTNSLRKSLLQLLDEISEKFNRQPKQP